RPVAIRLECAGETVRIGVTDVGTGEQERSILAPREDAPAARVRLLALTITELVASVWNIARHPTESVANAARPAPLAPVLPRATAWRLVADASLRRLGSPPAWLWGIAGGAELTLYRHFTLSLAASGETGNASTALAEVNESGIGGAIAVRSGLSLGRARVEAGPGFRAGLVRLSARPKLSSAQGASFNGLAAGPFLSLRLASRLGRRTSIEARVESGLTTHKATGLANDTVPLVDTGGWWFGLALGAGLEIL
ncbi:MAG TPA: hypothetical protein VF518_13520, partial [Polyangia bacterium]